MAETVRVRHEFCALLKPGVRVRINDGSAHVVVMSGGEDEFGAYLDFNGEAYWVSDTRMIEVLPTELEVAASVEQET